MGLFKRRRESHLTPSNFITHEGLEPYNPEPVVFNSVLDFPSPFSDGVNGLMAKSNGSPYTFVCWDHQWNLMVLEFNKPPETSYYREVKRALMQDILTNGMTPEKKERLKEAEQELRYEA